MLHLVVHKDYLDDYQKLRMIEDKEGNDLPGELLPLGESHEASKKLVQALEGIGYSSQRLAAKNNSQRGFRGV